MTIKVRRRMSTIQRRRLTCLLAKSIPNLSFEEAQAGIQAKGTLRQGVHAAFEPFLRGLRAGATTGTRTSIVLRSQYNITVAYRGKSTIKTLLKTGKYDWQNNDISDRHFPQIKKRRQNVRVKLVHFRHIISTRDALSKLKNRGLRPANPAELLALGAAYPHLQRCFPIIALGQNWLLANGDRLVVCLAWHSMLRRVHLLCQLRRDWPEHCRFAVVAIKESKRSKLPLERRIIR